MGCVSSKHLRKDLKRERVTIINNNGGGGGYVNHVVSLTSSTYGALRLDNDRKSCIFQQPQPKPSSSSPSKEPEVINAWELMEGLEDGGIPISNQPKKSPKSSPFLRGFIASESPSPLKFLNQYGSPKTVKKNKVSGKENRVRCLDYSNSPKGIVLRSTNSSPNSSFQAKGSPICGKRNSFGNKSSSCSRRPLFDPELVASYEKELSEEEEQIKRMVWATPKTRAQSVRKSAEESHSVFLSMFEEKCPPGGEKSVVIYTTTLRGIRKTFEDCNKVRSVVESHCVHVLERDVSMDSGFKEELRKLMGTKQVKVPVVFVKGRLIGGAEQVLKLEEEGKLDILFEGIPKAPSKGCQGCAGVRFVMCKECNGSCKVLDEEKKNTVRCCRCNENGIVQCPICR